LEVDWRILATDISTQVLKRAEAGVYLGQRFAGLERGEQRRYFDHAATSDTFVVKPAIRQHVAFRRMNLANPPYPMRGPFDIIFCRNVMIYFDQLVRQRLISAMEKLLRPGGYLLIGHAEALSGIRMNLKMLRPSIFIKTEAEP
jgi:chemotaxis protein methyltransferase CheR